MLLENVFKYSTLLHSVVFHLGHSLKLHLEMDAGLIVLSQAILPPLFRFKTPDTQLTLRRLSPPPHVFEHCRNRFQNIEEMYKIPFLIITYYSNRLRCY